MLTQYSQPSPADDIALVPLLLGQPSAQEEDDDDMAAMNADPVSTKSTPLQSLADNLPRLPKRDKGVKEYSTNPISLIRFVTHALLPLGCSYLACYRSLSLLQGLMFFSGCEAARTTRVSGQPLTSDSP